MLNSIEKFELESISVLMVELFGIYIHRAYRDLKEVKMEIESKGKAANFNKLTHITSDSKIGFASKNREPDNSAKLQDTMWSIYKCFEFILTNDIVNQDLKTFCIDKINEVKERDVEFYLTKRKNPFERNKSEN